MPSTSTKPLRLVSVWVLLCALFNCAGWMLSACHQLNGRAYAAVLLTGAIAAFAAWKQHWFRLPKFNLWEQKRRFSRLFPAAFAVLAALAFLGGAIHGPANYDALAYRLPRVLHWLAEGKWQWIHTCFQRLNTRSCGYEWLAAPIIALTRSFRLLFLIDFAGFLLLPGLFFSVLTRLGVARRAAYYWMWVLPTGYSYLLQAGSIANDMFGGIFALAALDFALRAREGRDLRDLWLSILAVALLTGSKTSNLPLALQSLIVVLPVLPLLLERLTVTVAVCAVAALASFLPMAVLNYENCHDWTGWAAERTVIGRNDPGLHVFHNSIVLVVENLAPPIFPWAQEWNQAMIRIIPAGYAARLYHSFEPIEGELQLPEMQMEEGSGLGFGVTVLLLATVAAMLWRGRSSMEAASAKFGGRFWHAAILISPWIAILPFMIESGWATAARLVTPYYGPMIPLLLMGDAESVIVRKAWWRRAAVAVFIIGGLLLVLSPSRPLWPARTILSSFHSTNASHLHQRADAVYETEGRRPEAMTPLLQMLPDDAKVVGLVTFDDPEASLWLPFGKHRFRHVIPGDSRPALDAAGVKYLLVSRLKFPSLFGEPLDQWLDRNDAKIVNTMSVTLRAAHGPEDWSFIELMPTARPPNLPNQPANPRARNEYMMLLILVCGLYLAAAIILESRLLINTLLERAIVIYSLAAGQLLLSVQALSLATDLNSLGLILAGMASFGLSLCVLMVRRAPAGRAPWQDILALARAELIDEKGGHFVIALFSLAVGLISLNAIAGAFMIPLGDAYHFEKPLFWMQYQSIKPFITHDPRITSTSFVGEALGLPGFVFCKSGLMWLAVVGCSGVLSVGVVFSLARRLGCSPRASAAAALLLLGIPVWQQYYLQSNAAMSLAGLWVGASMLFLIRCDGAEELSAELLTRLGCSVFCFMLACGAKNTTLFLAPVFLLALVICLRRLLFKSKVLLVLAVWGTAGLLCSGVPWNYACNLKWYGNVSGPPFLQGHLSGDRTIPSVWTRCCRGGVLFLFDINWLPRSAHTSYEAVCQKAVGLLGGKKELAEDSELFNFQYLLPGEGIGLIGPLVVLPAFIYGVLLLRRGSGTGREDKFPHRRTFFFLLLFAWGSSFLCHVFLKWQCMGLWRLIPAFPLLAVPVCGLLLEKTWQRMAILTLAGLCALVPISADLSMIGNRYAPERFAAGVNGHSLLQKAFSKFGKSPPMEIEYQWENDPPQKAFLHEYYNGREIPLMFLEKARHPAVIAFAGGICSDAYYFFGPDLSNQITPLRDVRQPEQLLEPPANADYLVFAENSGIDPVKETLWATRLGYQPFLRVNAEHECLFLAFQKIPVPKPGID